ncbi:geranylgeranyl reductase family protein [Candidatus Synechococcus calcipolaris G9]|uniref:Geranylgeranyl reductase family protein n=1 Tax=Candidatus Synechococcus calcipolaris G9 TaxID=1497997 RepID=A0ABT6ETY1_9SYNE|nr:geranylgeranyl reductase family protein [Candidatus Synechococcus calcipolaris]MDG2989333.1 geranylgeranyl reductase family protein [Candidatus Synechococcus calcipolaris G9]
MYDCIIVGAGPAGGAAAYHLAKRGRSVLILEKEVFPRYKPCGGGVSPAIAPWFDFDFSPAISLKLRTLRYTWKFDDAVEVELETPEPIWLVRRDVFDHFLVQQAQAQGATLQDQTSVTAIEWLGDRWRVQTPQEPLEAQYLIGADGAKGMMAQWLGLREPKRRSAAALEAQPPLGHDQHIHFEFGMTKNGYIWNFPKADGYSIGMGTFRGGDTHNFEKTLADYAQRFKLAPEQCRQYDHPLCLWDGQHPLHSQNALLAGEAASLVDPFSAEGIRPAIYSGMQGAIAIDRALGGDINALEAYTAEMNNEWGTDMVWAQRLAGVFYRIPGVSYRLGVKRPAATRRMGQVLCGELRYRDVAGNAIKRLSSGLIPGRS